MMYIFLLAILGMVFVYPAYFYMLYEFKQRLIRDHPALWETRRLSALAGPLQIAYKALREVREGRLDGVALSKPVNESHRFATFLLYSGMTLFMTVLFVGLYDAVWGSGSQREVS
ncbi:hypothetical protein [Stenotrophomonas sp.]|uniref:hypothetical protein n=1 Tax=Stenotrophomonas sp. TaxID=69392 RepID=UPI0028A105F5|nr:hypothetical protein [Stenotrophomonas sp.]